jgi:hypothetical protein
MRAVPRGSLARMFDRDHGAPMQAMVRQLPYVGANGTMRLLMISLPMVEVLLDGVRYFRVEERPEANRFHVTRPSRQRLAQVLRPGRASRQLTHRNPALVQDGGNVRRAAVDLAVEGRLRQAALAQHLADRNPAGGSQSPDAETPPLAVLDQQ